MSNQFVQVEIYKESGCDINEGEYSVILTGLIGYLDLNERGGESDYHLIQECISEWVTEESANIDHGIDAEYCLSLILTERIEHQDVFATKWFEVDSYKFSEGYC